MPLEYHELRLGDRGLAVEALKRATYRLLGNGEKWKGFVSQSRFSRRFFGPFFKQDLALLQRRLSAGVYDGVLDRETFQAIVDSKGFDATAEALWRKAYPPTLVQPKQGFSSLHKSLWEPYSIGRKMGMSDLGTYNPASLLPSGAPSDHAVFPAFAFDLGITPSNGYTNTVGRKFFDLMAGRPGIHYVILGDKIWSTEKGLHDYTAGGHSNHVHVSGVRIP